MRVRKIKKEKKINIKKEKIINYEKEYTDLKKTGSFSGVKSFYRELKKKNKNVKYNDVKNYLMENDSYTLHKPKNKKFRRSRIIVPGMNHTLQIDLCDMRSLAKENDGFLYILTMIDVFSKKAWAFKLKNKSGKSVLEALSSILTKTLPKYIHADQGTEFFNKDLGSFLKKHDIKLYFTNSEVKASIVERFNRTIKEKMWRYFEYSNDYRYIDVLDDLIKNYNNSYHSSIKCAPNKVNLKNQSQIFFNLYGFNKNEDVEPYKIDIDLKVGDHVRISKNKKIFDKGYTNNWRNEIFVVDTILYRDPILFILKDLNDEIIEGKFYKEEIQKIYINENKDYKIENIIKTRTKNKKKEYFVSWKGYPPSFNSWVKEENLL